MFTSYITTTIGKVVSEGDMEHSLNSHPHPLHCLQIVLRNDMPPKNKSINNIYEDDEDAEDDALIGSINSWQPPGRTGDGGGGGSGKEILFISLLILVR